MKKSKNSGLVYSTEHGRICPGCSQPVPVCTCKARSSSPKGDGIVRIRRETKGRKGSGVTVITGLPLGSVELQNLAAQLKKKCGAGGTVKDRVVEIQGEHREVLMAELQKLGWTVKDG